MSEFEYLFKRNFVESFYNHDPIYVALRKGRSLLCLPCLISEKIEVEFETKKGIVNHLKVEHPQLMKLLRHDSTPQTDTQLE